MLTPSYVQFSRSAPAAMTVGFSPAVLMVIVYSCSVAKLYGSSASGDGVPVPTIIDSVELENESENVGVPPPVRTMLVTEGQ